MTDQPPTRSTPADAPPEAWPKARELAARALAPVERFLHVEAASGILLLVAAALALAWANSPWADAYAALWHTPVGVRLGPWAFERDLHFWINDGLMTIFFFVVGLEIRREMHRGELSELRRAALPLAAALGGMLLPAAIFIALNAGRPSASGWGIPMATDIAFAVGVLALLGPRVPAALRILLLALAVIDDVGAIIVIAVFYSTGFAWAGLAVAAGGVALVLVLQKLGVRATLAYLPAALVVWAGIYAAGVHPTLAGVLVGLLTPVRAWYGAEGFVAEAERGIHAIRGERGAILPHLDSLAVARREAVAPVERLIHKLHGTVAFAIMPLFALANAGVPLGSAALGGDGLRVFLGVALGLAVGKPLGVLLLSWAATRAGWASRPAGVGWPALSIVGLTAGIGFTMALFIAGLALPPGPLLETAKLAILCGSGVAAVVGYLAGRRVLRAGAVAGAAATPAEAEASTHA
jgi:NhaA family Na+:H+ antiporter